MSDSAQREVAHAEANGTRLRDRIARLLGPYCRICQEDWPCRGALQAEKERADRERQFALANLREP